MQNHTVAITNDVGVTESNVAVTVNVSGGSAATVYADKAGVSTAANPIVTGPLGALSFYAGDGLYDLVVPSGGGRTAKTTTIRISDNSGQGVAPGVPGFVFDDFLDTTATALTAHTGVVGATWTLPGSESTAIAKTINNAIGSHAISLDTAVSGLAAGHYLSSGTPPSADYFVRAIWNHGTAPADGAVGISLRTKADCSECYLIQYNWATSAWQLYKKVAGTLTQLGSDVAQTLTASTAYEIMFSAIGTALLFTVDKVTKFSTTDAAVTAVGKVGLRWVSPTTGGSAGGNFTQVTGQSGSEIIQRSIGDSVTVGYKAIPQSSKRWAYLLALLKGRNDYTRSQSSTLIMNQTSWDRVPTNNQVFLNFAYASTDVVTWFTGYNDMAANGTNANAAETYQRCLRAGLAWICRAPADVIQMNNGTWTPSGTWTAQVAHNINGRNSSAGTTCTGTISGTAITVCYNATFLTAGSMGVTIDGVLVDTIDVQFGTVSAFNSGGGTCRVVPMAKRYSGLSAGNHTVTLTRNSGSVFPLFACGTNGAAGPTVYVADPLRVAGGNDAQSSLYATKIGDVLQELIADGYAPKHVLTNNYFVQGTDENADGIHPNNSGYQHMSDAFAAAG